MGLWDRWLGRSIDLNSESAPFWRGFFGLGTTSGETVTFDTAMQLDAVWACVRLIGNSVRTLPCLVYKDDGVTVDKENALYDLLHDMPNLDHTASEFWGMVALCLCLDGNFFAEKKMSGNRLVALEPLHPLAVDVKRDDRNNRYYEVTERVAKNGRGGKRRVNENRMFHVRGELLPGCDRGLSPIGMERNVIGNALAGEKAGGKVYKSGLIATTFLMTDQKLDAPQRKQIGDTLTSFMGAEKAGGVAVLEAGFEPKSISINPKDAQMLETRQYSVEQVCRIFGVPPVMIGHAANGTTTWGSGIEQLILQFVKTCLAPMLVSIEGAVKRDLLTAQERKKTSVKFSIEGLLRGDSAARAEFLSKMVGSGIYHVDEARAYENKAPTDGGNHSIVNGTMTRLDKLGEKPANSNTPAPASAQQGAA